MEDAQTKLFDSTGAFFAFSGKQFEEGKKEGVTYVNCGSGLLCPEENVDTLINGLDDIHKKAIQQDIAENGADKIIAREIWNYESFYTMDPTDAKGAISVYNFSDELFERVWKQEFKKALAEDLI